MGNWSELTIDNGRLEVTENGRTNDLESRASTTSTLEASDEYFQRYSPYGAGFNGGTAASTGATSPSPPTCPAWAA
jgi:hypothetical protein